MCPEAAQGTAPRRPRATVMHKLWELLGASSSEGIDSFRYGSMAQNGIVVYPLPCDAQASKSENDPITCSCRVSAAWKRGAVGSKNCLE